MIVRTPEFVHVPYMLPPPPERSWTEQPGAKSEWLCVDVLGASEHVGTPAEKNAADAVKVERAKQAAPQMGASIVRLRDYQQEAVEAVFRSWESGKKAPLIIAATGCHARGQGILMYDGSVKSAENVSVGDLLMGPDSAPRRVTSLIRGKGKMVRVVPVKGDPWTVNEEHVLSLIKTSQGGNRPGGSITDVEVRDWERWGATAKHIHKLFRVPVVFPVQPLPITTDPYFLGLYLGDGRMSARSVSVSKPDEGDEFSRLGLMQIQSEHRFIPEHYKRGSWKVRCEVLAGLLDADGSASNKGYDFISKSERLSKDVAFVARSLGLAAYVSLQSKGCRNDFVGCYWRVSISGDSSSLPLRVPRKKTGPRVQKKDVLRTGFKVEHLAEDEFYGWSLDGDRRYLLEDFTVTHNSGKTILAAEIMRRATEPRPSFRAIFIAHRKELLDQTVAKTKLVAPRCTVGLVAADTNEIDRKITVASVQTLAARGGQRLIEVMGRIPPKLVVIDECHHSVSPTYRRVIEQIRQANPNVLLLGLTATPGRADGTGLDEVFDHVAYEKNLFDLVRDGYLVPPRGVRVKLDISLDEVDSKNGDFVEAQLAKVMGQPSVLRAIVRAWQEHGHDRKMIVFCCSVQHAHDLAQEFTNAGYPAASIDGSMKAKDRSVVYERFRIGHVKLLCSVEVLTEGFDEPSAEGVIFARPTASQSLYSQMLGRGLRLYPGKTECLVIDLVGNSEKHSPVQLASLAGLRPIENENAPADALAEGKEQDEAEAHVNSMQARELDFHLRAKRSRYAWRETTYGWTLQIPRVGYFLVAWHDQDKTRATVRFHDLREGRRDSAPTEVVRTPLDFEMAYGLVEGEVERLTAPRAKRPTEDNVPPAFAFLYEDGLEQDTFVAERLLLNDADWRSKPMTPKQADALRKLGVKERSLPQTAGEAADLITVMNVEFDVKMREPATDKQMWYLRMNKIPHEKNLTKNAAKRLILAHRSSSQNGTR